MHGARTARLRLAIGRSPARSPGVHLVVFALVIPFWAGRSDAKPQLPPRGATWPRPVARIAPTACPPLVDGVLTEPCWRAAVTVRPFHLSYQAGWAPYHTEAALTYDAEHLYVGLRSRDPDRSRHPKLPWPPDRDPTVAEVLLAAGFGQAFYKVAVTDNAQVHVTQPMAHAVPWQQPVTAAMKRCADGWCAEFALPFAGVDLPAPRPTCTWRINLGWRTPKCVDYSAWAVTHAWFYEPQYFGDLHFGGPRALTAELGEVTAPQPGHNRLPLTLVNRDSAAAECEIIVTLEDTGGTRVVFQQAVTVPGGESTEVMAHHTLADGLDGIATVTVGRQGAPRPFFRQPIPIKIPPNVTTYRAIQTVLAALPPHSAELPWLATEKNNLTSELQEIGQRLLAADVSAENWRRLTRSLERLLGRAHKLRWRFDHRAQLGTAPFAVATEHTLQKLFRDRAHNTPPTHHVCLAAARGEYENAQLVVIPLGVALHDLAVSVTPLTGPNGATIPATGVDIRWTGFVETRQPRYPVDHVGWLADPLIPLMASPRRTAAHALHQPLWLTVAVPRGIPAGIYTGQLAVRATGCQPWPLQLRVQVYDFDLPRRPALCTSMWLNEDRIKDWYGWDHIPSAIRRKQMAFLLAHRINPSWFGPIGTAADIEFQLDHGLNQVMLGVANQWPLAPDQEQRITRHYHFFRRKGLLGLAFIYGQDEPSEPDYPRVRATLEQVAEHFPGVRRACTAYPPAAQLEGAVDTWVVGPNLLNYDAVAARLAAGDELWIYLSASVRRPYVTQFYLDYTGLEHRLFTWCCWKYGATGFLYWGINEWQSNNQPWSGRPAIDDAIRAGKRWPEVPWNTWTYLNCNGDAQYVYPGLNGEFWSSVRLEIMRDAFEDYDYLTLLNATRTPLVAAQPAQLKSLVAKTEQLTTVGPPLLGSLSEATEDPHVLLHRRDAIAQQLEQNLAILAAAAQEAASP